MKNLKNKITSIIIVSGMVFTMFSTSVNAADTPSNSRPSVTYGSTYEFSNSQFFGPWQDEKWNYYANAYKYDSWSKDVFVAINAKANVSLTSTSTSSYTLFGSTEFGIKKIAQANLGGTFGKSWGKTSTVSFDAQKGYTYELWSANKMKIEKYKYTYKPLLSSKKTLYSTANDSEGTYKWFFRTSR